MIENTVAKHLLALTASVSTLQTVFVYSNVYSRAASAKTHGFTLHVSLPFLNLLKVHTQKTRSLVLKKVFANLKKGKF